MLETNIYSRMIFQGHGTPFFISGCRYYLLACVAEKSSGTLLAQILGEFPGHAICSLCFVSWAIMLYRSLEQHILLVPAPILDVWISEYVDHFRDSLGVVLFHGVTDQ
jgi:hypothetical protein